MPIHTQYGYGWHFTGEGDPSAGSGDEPKGWERIELLDSVPVKIIGRRNLIGADVIIVRALESGDHGTRKGEIYAQTALEVHRSKA